MMKNKQDVLHRNCSKVTLELRIIGADTGRAETDLYREINLSLLTNRSLSSPITKEWMGAAESC